MAGTFLNVNRAHEIMAREGVDVVVATMPENVLYLSDFGNYRSYNFAFTGVTAAIYPRKDTSIATLIVTEFDMPHMGAIPSWMPELRIVRSLGTYGAVKREHSLTPNEKRILELYDKGRASTITNRQRLIGATLKELGLHRSVVAFDDLRVLHDVRDNDLPEGNFRDGLSMLREIRMIKTPAEIALLREAAIINETALTSVANLVGEGVSTGELVRHYKIAMAAQDAFGSHITGGGDSFAWPGHPNLGYRLKRGDLVHLDAAGWFRRYWADGGRTAVIGDPSDKFQTYYGELQASHAFVDPMIRPGMSAKELSREAASVLREVPKAGFAGLVHSIGLEQWEGTDDLVFEEGMLINLETLYFEYGWGPLQIEDTFLVTSGEPERLTKIPQEPFIANRPPSAGY